MQNSFSLLPDAGSYQALPPVGEADPIPEALYDALQSPSLFGRILRIAAFRTTATDRYDAGHAARFHTPAIEDALRHLHAEVFTRWLALSLQRQQADINIYLNLSPGADRAAKIKQLIAVAERSMPAGAKPTERQLFVQDLKIVQVLFKYDQ